MGLLARGQIQLRGDIAALEQRVQAEAAHASDLESKIEDLDGSVSSSAERIAAVESLADAEAPDTTQLAATTAPSVFTVTAGDASGSAWVVSSSESVSRLITNYHVVSSAWKDGDRAVQLHEGEKVWDAKVVDVSEGADLAVIEVNAPFHALARADETPAVGDPVLAIGAPLGLDDSVSTGIVSAIRTEGVDDYIQFSAPVSPGSSGGPLVNDSGEVVGVTVMKAVTEGAEGLGFAIPVSLVCDVVDC